MNSLPTDPLGSRPVATSHSWVRSLFTDRTASTFAELLVPPVAPRSTTAPAFPSATDVTATRKPSREGDTRRTPRREEPPRRNVDSRETPRGPRPAEPTAARNPDSVRADTQPADEPHDESSDETPSADGAAAPQVVPVPELSPVVSDELVAISVLDETVHGEEGVVEVHPTAAAETPVVAESPDASALPVADGGDSSALPTATADNLPVPNNAPDPAQESTLPTGEPTAHSAVTASERQQKGEGERRSALGREESRTRLRPTLDGERPADGHTPSPFQVMPDAEFPVSTDPAPAAISAPGSEPKLPVARNPNHSPAEAAGRPTSSLNDRLMTRAADRPSSSSPLTPADHQRFMQRVTKAFDMARHRQGEIRLRLSPPELGSLKLELRVEQGLVHARMEAETSAARQLLVDNLPALRERLLEQGIRIEQFDVDLMDRRDQQTDQGGRESPFEQAPQRRHDPPTRGQPERIGEPPLTRPAGGHDQTINVIV